VVKNPFIIWFFKQLETWIYRSADHVIVNSPGFIPYLQPVLPKQEILTFPNGVIASDFLTIDPQKTEAFATQYPLKDKFVVLYAGNLGKANDIECIIDAAEQLKDHPVIRFVLLGGGLSVNTFQKECEKRSLKNVIFIPSIPKKEIPHFMPLASVGIASLKDIPLFTTVYPNKVFDYMAAGIPTILSIGGVIRNVIENSKGGLYIPPGNPDALKTVILHYYTHPEDVKTQGKNAQHYVTKHFDREKIAADLEVFFQKVITKA
jgi:glycosyltransferase involved in cell wall biosynthesis